MLTGKLPQEHGIVGNGWLFRDTMEVRFWQQSNRLIQAEPVYATAADRAAAKGGQLQCQAVLVVQSGRRSGCRGDAEAALWGRRQQGFDVQSYPESLASELVQKLGRFSFSELLGADGGVGLHAMDRPAAPREVAGPGRAAAD